MLKQLKTLTVATVLFALISSSSIAQQLKVPAPSPLQTIKQAFALSDITIEYSRPSTKGRMVFSDLVPFGKVWRTGANASTKITFGEDVKVEGTDVKAGTYAIYSIPNKDSWEIMLYKDLTLGGNVEEYNKENELLRFVVKTYVAMDWRDMFTINIVEMSSSSAKIELSWEKMKVAFTVTAEIDSKIMKSIEASIVKDNRPFYQAATYYYENDKDLKQAGEFVDKAIAANPKAYWAYLLKAKIQAKQKDAKGAVVSAEKSKALAIEDKDDSYVKMADKLITENKK